MKKHIFLSAAMLFTLLSATAYAACQPTHCANGGDKGKGWSVIDVQGRRGNSASGSCYRCNWGDNNYECDEGTTLLIFKLDTDRNEVAGLYKCRDDGAYDDDWDQVQITATCKNSQVAKGASNSESYYSADYTKPSNSNVVINPADTGCIFYACKDGYIPNATKTQCEKDGSNTNSDDHNQQSIDFDECDTQLANLLYPAFVNAMSGQTINFNAQTALAIPQLSSCEQYINAFKRNVNTTIQGVLFTIDWAAVRSQINK